jgi:hypothetical protein
MLLYTQTKTAVAEIKAYQKAVQELQDALAKDPQVRLVQFN